MTLTDKYIVEELAAVKSLLHEPMTLKELRGVFGIKALERKLELWVTQKELYSTQILIGLNWTWHFALTPFPEAEKKLAPVIENPEKKKGIYKLDDDLDYQAKYNATMRLNRRSSAKVYVSGSSLSGF